MWLPVVFFTKTVYHCKIKSTIHFDVNVSLLPVSASDKDGSTILSYTVTDPIFSITTTGNGQVGVIHTNG